MYRENRWFTSTGRRKRVPTKFEIFRDCIVPARNNPSNINQILTIKNLRKKFNLSLSVAYDLATFLHGMFNNKHMHIEKFHRGKLVYEQIACPEKHMPKVVRIPEIWE